MILYYRLSSQEQSVREVFRPMVTGASRGGGFMFGLGFGELLVLLVIVMVLFNRRLPELGEGLGKSIKRFRKAMSEPDDIDITPKDDSKKP